MKMLVMRHGQAETRAASDFDRALTPVGAEQAIAAGRLLSSLDLGFGQLWVSPYLRTQQTADHVMAALPGCSRIAADFLVPESLLGDVLTALEDCVEDNLLVVSHQPLVSTLLGSLVGAKGHIPMAPASMALLEAPVMAAGCAHLEWLRHAPDFERE